MIRGVGGACHRGSMAHGLCETKRALETRIKEHKAATRRGETTKSAIAEHAWKEHHVILWDETKVLDQAKNNTTLLIKEALYIRLSDTQLINRDEGVTISDCWRQAVSHAAVMTSSIGLVAKYFI